MTTLWLGTEHGLARKVGDRWETVDERQAGVAFVKVHSLAETAEPGGPRTLWAATEGGLAALSDGAWRLLDKRSGLPSSITWSLAAGQVQGHRNVLWVGTGGGGLVRWVEGGWRQFGSGPSLLRTPVSAILEARDGSFWVAGEGGLARFAGGAWSEIASPSPEGPVFSLAEVEGDRGPELIAGTTSGALARREGERWVSLGMPSEPENIVRNILQVRDPRGGRTLWVGRKVGLARLQRGAWRVFGKADGLANDWVLGLAATAGPVLWAGTFGGVLRFDGTSWQTQTSASSPLPRDMVPALLATSATRLWIGTAAGAARVDLEGAAPQWKSYSTSTDPPLPDVPITGIRDDGLGGVYFFTNDGVLRLSAEGGRERLETFGAEDGLPSAECVHPAGLVDREGRVWAGTMAGLAVLAPPRVRKPDRPSPLLIERAAVGTGGSPLADGQSLAHDQGHLAFELSLLSYFRDGETKFRTQLVGLESEPTEWTAEPRREFPTLPPGSYQLLAWGRDYAGNVSGPVGQRFSVRPPPWATWWAFALYAAGFVGLSLQAIRLRTRALQERARLLEAKVVERTREVEQKNEQLSSAIHEVQQKNDELLESYKQADRIFSALADALSGTTLDGKYKLEEKIGEGGFGAVFRATDDHGAPVAIKVFRPQSGNESVEALERFRLEGLSASRVAHPNAINVLDSGVSAEGIAYLAMELLEGRSLAAELRDLKKLPVGRSLAIAIPVCAALAEAHRAGIVHRDIKPDNIFLHRAGADEVVKVVDFGVAKLQDTGKKNKTLTVTGAVVGTPTYMAPERLENLPYDGRSDVYSVGIVLYEMLCGKPPFESNDNNLWSIVMMHLTRAPPPPTELDPTIPEEVARVVLGALAKNPAERPTALVLAEQLSQAARA